MESRETSSSMEDLTFDLLLIDKLFYFRNNLKYVGS